MKTTLTSDNLSEIILQEYPDNFSSDHGLTETVIDCAYKGTKVRSKQIFFDGVMIQHGHYDFKDSLILNSSFDCPIFEMHFYLKGQSSGSVNGFKKPFSIKRGEHALTYVSEPEARFYFDGNTSLEGIEVCLTPKYFQRFQNHKCAIIDGFLEAMEKQQALHLPGNGQIDPLMRNTIDQMLLNPFKGSVRRLYMEAKMQELFAAQLESFQRQMGKGGTDQNAFNERDKLYHAKQLIEECLSNPPTIQELSQLVNLNEFKLKKGFKALFGHTIFGYVTEYRLEIARQCLLDTERSIAEISDMIGYSQQQHFSTAFKRKYGITPSELRG